MTAATADMTPDETTPPRSAARPFRLAMLVPALLVDVAAPIAIFKGLEAAGVFPIWALTV